MLLGASAAVLGEMILQLTRLHDRKIFLIFILHFFFSFNLITPIYILLGPHKVILLPSWVLHASVFLDGLKADNSFGLQQFMFYSCCSGNSK